MKILSLALAAVVALGAVSCSNSNVMTGFNNVEFDPSSPIVRQERKMASVRSLETSVGVRVFYEQSDELSLVVEAPKDIIGYITTTFDGDELDISSKCNLGNSRERVTITVKCPRIVDFEVNSGSSIVVAGDYVVSGKVEVDGNSGGAFSAKSFKVGKIDAESSSGAAVSISGIESGFLKGESSSGSAMRLSGTATAVDLSVSSGATLNATDLKVQNGSVSATSGGLVSSNIANVTSMEKNSGGSISNTPRQ